MAKGAIGKEEVLKRIATAFGDDFIGEFDKKIYVWANENGDRVQIALSMTCPKTQIMVDNGSDSEGFDFEDISADGAKMTPTAVVNGSAPAEITQEEQDNIASLIAKLGL